ncbi:hypothetical protein AGABI2DRAFT_197200 [Agaricus bisporus var. bisporus H97]|uniref:hypothetical protein n=1 Tax=Agaricus bisporus var. bisporus (strain H97 / ATCC MYA-4626 / FGSC 10389) TaxID=936046 RepID=UPI00029F6A5B|nr:hypothetical protein AGABI2DRAFT_197200 [Agaricus bisporus var. bisporus H97]EKV51306.1 hypothetical protein AGABI2DRAFT_197200 [Agaricus bisporus var. bisporus H97]
MVISHEPTPASSSSSSIASKHSPPSSPDLTVPQCHLTSRPHAVVTDHSFKFATDIERASSSGSNTWDPYEFRNGILDDTTLSQLSRRKKGKRIARYQRRQNDLISSLLKPMEEHTEEAQSEEEAARLPVRIAVYGSLICNFALCILQMYAAVSSASLSLLATGIDSVFDIGSNVVLFWLHKKAQKLDSNKWPVGGSRLETIGNVVYGSLMGMVNLVVIVESIRTIITKKGDALAPFHLPSIIAVAAALVVKFVLFLYSYSIRKRSSQVQVLWEDHRNDLWINAFGILMSCGGSKLVWYLDPMGGTIIAAGIIISWGRTIYGQFELLAGKSAPHDFLQLLIFKAATFSEDIVKIDTVRAYHSGPEYFVEIDVVMDANVPLWKAHDISQQLQDKIEVLPNVERAFVHVDHETSHTPEHRKSKLIVI